MAVETTTGPAAEGRGSAERIRGSALRLYAARGPEGVGVREIAADAAAAPGLIRHHFGSKAGLTRAVDDHVLEVIAAALARVPADGSAADVSAARDEAFARVLREHAEIAGYLRWCLIMPGSSPDADGLAERLVDLTLAETERLRRSGVGGSRDPRMSVLTTMLRQIGSMVVQPLSDRIWERLEAVADPSSGHTAAPRVSIAMSPEPAASGCPSTEPAPSGDAADPSA